MSQQHRTRTVKRLLTVGLASVAALIGSVAVVATPAHAAPAPWAFQNMWNMVCLDLNKQ